MKKMLKVSNLFLFLTSNSNLFEIFKKKKVYTCARCPEIFSSSNLLRKHVSESHEKGFVLYNIWGN
jgi:hypothetical protein